MNNDAFQWDDAKAAANYAKHGVTFEAARDVFKDPFAIEQMDDRQNYGEERWTILGIAQDRLLLVAYTMRNDSIRITSARGAEPYEKREYHEQNARND
jgi:uncharacterized DUF497 family protein